MESRHNNERGGGMSKHYQIGDRIRCRKHGYEGNINGVNLAGGQIKYTFNTEIGWPCMLYHEYAELVEPAPERHKGVTIADVEEIAGKWALLSMRPFFEAVATYKPAPKFKVGDRVLNGIGSLATISRVVGFEYDRYLYDLAYPGGGVGVNFPEGELVPVPTGSEFSATYRFNGETHGLILRATNRDEAEAKCRTLGATLDGEIG